MVEALESSVSKEERQGSIFELLLEVGALSSSQIVMRLGLGDYFHDESLLGADLRELRKKGCIGVKSEMGGIPAEAWRVYKANIWGRPKFGGYSPMRKIFVY